MEKRIFYPATQFNSIITNFQSTITLYSSKSYTFTKKPNFSFPTGFTIEDFYANPYGKEIRENQHIETPSIDGKFTSNPYIFTCHDNLGYPLRGNQLFLSHYHENSDITKIDATAIPMIYPSLFIHGLGILTLFTHFSL